jgi:TPP-dependent pyruvate/acetoin dehydrogenase alpha subunit
MRALYRHMVLTRALEDRLESLFKQGHVVGGLYRCLGQEATAVGSSYALEDGDWLAPSIRDVGALYVRGLPPIAMLRQYAARAASPCAGKDNTTHFTIPELGLLGPISPLGTQLCVLNGMALTFKQRGESRVCMTYQGEGASRTGASHEGFVMAAALDLPMVIVLEHNRWSFGTRSDRAAAVQDWAHTAEAYGLPVRSVDGNDVLEVYEAAREAVDRARAGGGPGVIVAETYRMLGHAQHDSQKYMAPEELETRFSGSSVFWWTKAGCLSRAAGKSAPLSTPNWRRPWTRCSPKNIPSRTRRARECLPIRKKTRRCRGLACLRSGTQT